MQLLIRYIRDHRHLWPMWLPLLVCSAILPLYAVAIPLVQKEIIDAAVIPRRLDLLAPLAALYAGIWTLSLLTGVVSNVLRAYFGERMAITLRQRLFGHAGDLSLAFARREHTARTLSLFVNDVPSVTGLFSSTVIDGLGIAVAMAVAGTVMVFLNIQLALVAILGPGIAAIGAWLVTRPLRPLARSAQEKAAEMVERIHEHLTGMREVIAFGRIAGQQTQFTDILWRLLRARMQVASLNALISSGASLTSLAMSIVILVYGAYLVIEGKTTLGTVIATQSLFALLFQPAGQVIGLFTSVQTALGAADRIYGFLDTKPEVVERADAERLQFIKGEVCFDHVDFGYRDDQRVLNDISFTARPGEMIALVGPSGVGKTTLSSLIARFYDPTQGRVLVDGHDIRDVVLADLRQQIAIVFQDTFLFAGSVYENIAFGLQGATDDQIVMAAKAANAWEFIEHFPKRLTTQVGERGIQLSEGQRQRISVARALLRDPRILILDEPTSALDARSEGLLQAALETLMSGRTTFVIAHRLATVRKADRILVLDGGRIAEEGTHEELLLRNGVYREFFDLQFGTASAVAPEDPLLTA